VIAVIGMRKAHGDKCVDRGYPSARCWNGREGRLPCLLGGTRTFPHPVPPRVCEPGPLARNPHLFEDEMQIGVGFSVWT
jgi:hypothetical protein